MSSTFNYQSVKPLNQQNKTDFQRTVNDTCAILAQADVNYLTASTIGFFWIVFFLPILIPRIREAIRKRQRHLVIKHLEARRNTRVVTLVHRGTLSPLLGMLMGRFINIENSEEILKAIRETPKDRPIDLIVHTPGGLALATRQIANALANHPAKVTIIIPHFAMSGGTFLALAANQVLMDQNAVLGQIDPQIANMPAVSIQKVMQMKNPEDIDDRTIIMADISEKAIRQTREAAQEILKKVGYSEEKIIKITEELTSPKHTHDKPLTLKELKELGLKVKPQIPAEVYNLLNLYPQPNRGSAPVEYTSSPKSKTG